MTSPSVVSTSPNNLVAESDFRGALREIDNLLEQQQDENNVDGSLVKNLATQARTSFQTNLKKVVQVIGDDEYYERIRIEQDDATSSSSSSSSEEEPEELDESELEFEVDEEELMDEEAIKRVRELRNQVRATSERIVALRNSVSERAIALAKQETQLVVGYQQEEQHDSIPIDSIMASIREPKVSQEDHDEGRPLEMERKLVACLSGLKSMDTDLPKSMEQLQSMIETVESNLEKGNTESLSQTEKAIRSKSNELPVVERTTNMEASAPSDERLANFFYQFS